MGSTVLCEPWPSSGASVSLLYSFFIPRALTYILDLTVFPSQSGPPIFLTPSGVVSNTFLTDLLFFIRVICPAQHNLFIYMYSVISDLLNGLYNSCLYIFLQLPLSSRSRDSVVSIATSYGLDDRGVGVRVPVGPRIFSSPNRPDRL
jgi:hypothetical protein